MELSKTSRRYFEAAKDAAKLSDFQRVNIGCAVVYQHKVISTGCNTLRTEPMQKRLNIYRFAEDMNHCAHAEVRAIKPLIGRKDIDFKNVELYIYRQDRNGKLAMSRPCASCSALIRSLGIRHVYYTGNQSYVYEEYIY